MIFGVVVLICYVSDGALLSIAILVYALGSHSLLWNHWPHKEESFHFLKIVLEE